MEEFLKLFDHAAKMTLPQMVFSLILSALLGGVLNFVYRRTLQGINYTSSFPTSLILLPVIVCMIMVAIGSSLVLSLGLVGSLSILRFRTAIKDIKDMVYLFIAVGIGLCCGSANYLLALLGAFFFSFLSIVLGKFPSINLVSNDYILTVMLDDNQKFNYAKLSSVLNKNCNRWTERSFLKSNTGRVDFVCTFALKRGCQLADLIEQASSACPGSNVSAITPDSTVVY